MAANREAVERFEDTMEDILLYLRHAFGIFEELNRNSFTNGSNAAEILIIRCEEFVSGLSLLYRLMQWPDDIKQYFQEVIALFQERISRILERLNIEEGGNCSCPKMNDNGGIGRPKFLITKEQIDGLRSLHFSWKKIAEMLGVSERTVRRRKQEFDMAIGRSVTYSEIDDDELDIFVQYILHYSPELGERMLIGALNGFGVKVQRERLHNSIERVDPVSREMRRRTAIHRRLYNVKTPNALWYCIYVLYLLIGTVFTVHYLVIIYSCFFHCNVMFLI